ncbi:branched-chain amino acid transport system II carrier protein [Streptococcus catagoni]|uniref:branched-chain amino acid transport system II carrier protein n=1 Tax=Streptococcus catagoni TaxID=2654874 RepID=UPI00140B0C65|nr:branched-chain amino acid transport system II carrier protein [Streptococcus catagoni]
MQSKTNYLVIGFMLFALFFGAANLIYPAYIGVYSGKHLAFSILGFCLTGVSLPFFGVLAVSKSGASDVRTIASPVSKGYATLFAVLLYLSIGPFFAIPRTGATSFAIGISPILGDQLGSKLLYGLIFFGLSFLLAVKPSRLAENIGKYLTPALILVISIVIVFSFIHPVGDYGQTHNAGPGINNAFKDYPFMAGLIQGYGTMDALASLVFSIIVIDASKQFGAKNHKDITKMTFISGLIAISLLALIYIFIGRIGATSQNLFPFSQGFFRIQGNPINGGHILSHASHFYLGSLGQASLAMIIFLACLTTSTGLISSSAEFFHNLLPQFSRNFWAGLFTLVSASFYLGGLNFIIKWSAPVLYLLYPLTIILIILVLLPRSWAITSPVYKATTLFTFIPALYDALATLASMTGLFKIPSFISYFFTELVPLGKFSMGWISFALIGFLIGFILQRLKK